MPENFYDLLGVDEDATQADLKQAYRQRAREFHPDVNADDRAGAQFKTIRRAYDVLRDETERSAYDRLGHASYVRKRMKGGLPDDSPANPSSSSTSSSSTSSTSSSSATSSKRSSSTSNGSRSRESRSTASSSTASSTRNRTGSTDSRRNASTGSRREQSNSRGGPQSRRTTTGTTAAPNRRYSPSSGDSSGSRERLRNRWVAVAAAFALYLGGLGWYGLAIRPTLLDLVAALSTTPVAALTSAGGVGAPATFARTAVTTATTAPSPALLVPLGTLVLPLVLVWTVSSFGRGSAWLYVLAALGPLAGLGLGLAVPTVPTAAYLVTFVVLPVGAVLVFLGDVGRYLFATR